MKYLKSYESSIKNFTKRLKNETDPDKIESIIDEIKKDLFNSDSVSFEPGQVYNSDEVGDFCFIGTNGKESFKNICMLFQNNRQHDNRFSIIVWNDWFKSIAKPLNINVIDYIIKNDLIETTKKSLKRINFSSTPSSKERQIVYKFRNRILNNEKFIIAQKANKYNL